MIVPRFPGSLIPSRIRVRLCECWLVGVLEHWGSPLCRRGVGGEVRIRTTKSPSLLELRVVIRSSSFSDMILYGNLSHSGTLNSGEKNPSTISKSESKNSVIPFRHSTRKKPVSRRPVLSWRCLMDWILFLVSILSNTSKRSIVVISKIELSSPPFYDASCTSI